METEVRFRERQTFDQPWLWGLLAATALVDLVGFVRGRRSAREVLRQFAAVGAAALLLRAATLYTEVRTPVDGNDDPGVYVKFAPFHRSYRRIPVSDIADAQATEYSPLRYGGWGIRWRPGGIAYTVSGRRGVRLERTDGRSTLVGSERPDELLAAVREASNRTA